MHGRTSKPKRLSTVLAEVYEKLDKQVDRVIKEVGTSCKIRCSDCCLLLTTIGFAEGVMLAEEVFKRDWKNILPKLRASALAHCEDGITPASYLNKRLPCVFLDNNYCSVYQQRPACCRFHYVISDPKYCSPDANGSSTAVIDLKQAEMVVWSLSLSATQGLKQFKNKAIFSPIPVMVLFCMKLLSERDKEASPLVLEACKDIPEPDEWIKRYGDRIVEAEIQGKQGKVPEEEVVKLRTQLKERQ